MCKPGGRPDCGLFRLAGARPRGFTLVELLVVIAVIAILAGIIFVAYGPARESARQASCLSNLQNISVAVKMYLEEQQAYPPPAYAVTGEGGVFALAAYNYITDLKALRCPNDSATVDEYNAALQAALPSAQPWSQAWFNSHYSSYNVAVDKNGPTTALAVLYNYFGFYGPPNEMREEYRAVNIQNLAEAERVYLNVPDALGRSLWTASGPTASFPGLLNRQAPDSTIMTRCIQHRGRGYDLVATVAGRTERLRADYDWVRQP